MYNFCVQIGVKCKTEISKSIFVMLIRKLRTHQPGDIIFKIALRRVIMYSMHFTTPTTLHNHHNHLNIQH